jgi:hypothetical protein
MLIASVFGWHRAGRLLLAIALAFAFGYSLTYRGVRRQSTFLVGPGSVAYGGFCNHGAGEPVYDGSQPQPHASLSGCSGGAGHTAVLQAVAYVTLR